MKFGGSSVRDGERMREVAAIVTSFPEHLPAVVLSAMGKTTNNLLAAGAESLTGREVCAEASQNLRRQSASGFGWRQRGWAPPRPPTLAAQRVAA